MITFYLIISLITLISLMLFSIYANKIKFLDNPLNRSSHSVPTPKSAGIIICIIFSLIVYFLSNNNGVILISVSILSVLGLVDDIINLNAKIKFFFQSVFIILIYVLYLNLDFFNLFNYFSLNLFILCFLSIYFINIFNFMDGIDGLSLLQSLYALLVLILIKNITKNDIIFEYEIKILSVILLSHLCLFFTKFKVFLGDSGSLYIGLLILIFYFANNDIYLIFSLITIFSFYIFDTTVTLFKRILNRENIFEAHKKHIYQILSVKLNSHFKVNLLIIFFNIAINTPILILYNLNTHNYLLVFVPFVILMICYIIFYDYIRKNI